MNDKIKRFVRFNSKMREATLESEKAFLKLAGNLSTSQLHIILSIGDHANITMSELAQLLHFSKANITQMVDRLIRNKFVKKIQSKQDKRKMHLALLEKGRKVVRLNQEHVERVAKIWFSKLSEAEQEQMLNVFDRYFE